MITELLELARAKTDADIAADVQRRAAHLKNLPFDSLGESFEEFWKCDDAVKALLLSIRNSFRALEEKKWEEKFAANTIGKIFSDQIVAHMFWGVSSK